MKQIKLKKIKVFKEKFNDDGEPSMFYHQNKKYLPVLYQAKEDLNIFYMKQFKPNGQTKFEKFNKAQIKRLTGISDSDLDYQKDLMENNKNVQSKQKRVKKWPKPK
jgi:hypothetical protein